jgi:hypothetical protein
VKWRTERSRSGSAAEAGVSTCYEGRTPNSWRPIPRQLGCRVAGALSLRTTRGNLAFQASRPGMARTRSPTPAVWPIGHARFGIGGRKDTPRLSDRAFCPRHSHRSRIAPRLSRRSGDRSFSVSPDAASSMRPFADTERGNPTTTALAPARRHASRRHEFSIC